MGEIIVIATGVLLGLGLFGIVSNKIHSAQPTIRVKVCEENDDINHTAWLVQELYDEFITKRKEDA